MVVHRLIVLTLLLFLLLLLSRPADAQVPSEDRRLPDNTSFVNCFVMPDDKRPDGYVFNVTCSSGHVCFPLESPDEVPPGSGAFPRGLCVPCAPGQYCPTATDVKPSAEQFGCVFPCPAGASCLEPFEANPCPPGNYCPEGVRQPVICSTEGAYCPANSTVEALCPGGFYCPDTETLIECPSGSYCVEGSTTPDECPILASCPTGSKKPTLSFLGVVVLAVLIAALLAVSAFVYRRQEKERKLAVETLQARERADALITHLGHVLGLQDAAEEKFFHGFSALMSTVRVRFEHLSLTVPGGKTVIHDFSGEFPPGHITAVMGPSGCGKTSLLNVILDKARSYGQVSGSLTVNGFACEASALPRVATVGFAPQTNDVHTKLTVRQNVFFSAMLRMPKAMPLATKMAVVDDIIRLLNLAHIQHAVVGGDEDNRGISGGQRARVSLAMELASFPSLLLADEPTSGLDASSSLEVMAALKRLSRLGICVVVVIHQPRSAVFKALDRLMLLNDGRLCYAGRTSRVRSYFEGLGFPCPPNENVADYMVDVVSGLVHRTGAGSNDSEPIDLADAWAAHHDTINVDVDVDEDVEPAQQSLVSSGMAKGASAESVSIELTNRLVEETEEKHVADDDDDHDGEIVEFVRSPSLAPTMRRELAKDVSIIGLQRKDVYGVRDFEGMVQFLGGASGSDSELVMSLLGVPDDKDQRERFELSHDELIHRLTSIQHVSPPARANLAERSKTDAGSPPPQAPETPSLLYQLKYFTWRMVAKLPWMMSVFMLDAGLTISGAGLLSIMYGNEFNIYRYAGIASVMTLMMGLLSATGGMRTFSLERNVFMREADSGISVSAYFVANNIVWTFLLFCRAVLFGATIYTFMLPKSNFGLFLGGLLGVGWATTGIGQLVVVLFAPVGAILAGIFVPLAFGGVLGGIDPPVKDLESTVIGRILATISFGRWGTELLLALEVQEESETNQGVVSLNVKTEYGFDTQNRVNDAVALFMLGLGFRLCAWLVMWWKHQK